LTLTVTAEGAVTPGRYMISVGAASKDDPQVIAGNVGPILNVMPALAVDNAETPEDCPPSSGSQMPTRPANPVAGCLRQFLHTGLRLHQDDPPLRVVLHPSGNVR
jgi:hypothetical protein